jgi:ABC-type branched-subunit amino acid transport system permease subunit
VLVALSIPRIDPLMGLMTGLKAFVAAVLGGIGSIPGAMLGGMLIGLMETWIRRRVLHVSRRDGLRRAHSDPAVPSRRHSRDVGHRKGLAPHEPGPKTRGHRCHRGGLLALNYVFEYGFGDFQINPYYARIINLIGINITLAVSLNLINGLTGSSRSVMPGSWPSAATRRPI